MDTKKIGTFLKQCRKEKSLTQEQLAEMLGVSSKSVSRWETGTNMPDLGILMELAEYYDAEISEILDGERRQPVNRELKETLEKVAEYEEWAKQKAAKAGNLAFAAMFGICVMIIVIQIMLTADIRMVLGETVSILAGGIVYSFIMVYSGIWDRCLSGRTTFRRDLFISVICAGVFAVIYGICLLRMGAAENQAIKLALGFGAGIAIVSFIVLRILARMNQKKDQRSTEMPDSRETPISRSEWICIYNAQNIVEAEQIVEMLKQDNISAFSRESGASMVMHGVPGFGLYGIDIIVKTEDAGRAMQIIRNTD